MMKSAVKCGVICVIGALLAGSVSASGVSLGIKNGFNLAKPWGGEKGNEMFNPDYLTLKPGFIIGASLGITIVDVFSIQPEVLFSSKGFKLADGNSTMVYSMNFLEFPVLFRLNVPSDAAVPNLYIGPVVALRVGAGGYAKNGSDKENMPSNMVEAMKDNTNAYDFGLAMGAGVNIVAGPGCVVVDVRYTLGLVKIIKLSDESDAIGFTESDLPTEKHGVVSFMVGYAFDIGG